MSDPRLIAAIKTLADEIQSLAFAMPAPNEFTPQFVMLAQFARHLAVQAEMDAYNSERGRDRGEGMRELAIAAVQSLPTPG
jgi:hypothetical protein